MDLVCVCVCSVVLAVPVTAVILHLRLHRRNGLEPFGGPNDPRYPFLRSKKSEPHPAAAVRFRVSVFFFPSRHGDLLLFWGEGAC